jgi:hypothetical protein
MPNDIIFPGGGQTSAEVSAASSTSITGLTGTDNIPMVNNFRELPIAGYNYMAWLENASAAGTCTWYGDNTVPVRFQSGISGSVLG